MGRTHISIGISATEINRAIRGVEKYRRDFIRKVDELRRRVAERLANDAQNGFTGVVADEIIGAPRPADVTVSVSESGVVTVVAATGKDAVFVEFGAGVYNNGAVGTSPHPNGAKLGFTIGSFGKGMGVKNVWGFYEGDELRLTHGTPAAMPMNTAMNAIVNNIVSIAREVFR